MSGKRKQIISNIQNFLREQKPVSVADKLYILSQILRKATIHIGPLLDVMREAKYNGETLLPRVLLDELYGV